MVFCFASGRRGPGRQQRLYIAAHTRIAPLDFSLLSQHSEAFLSLRKSTLPFTLLQRNLPLQTFKMVAISHIALAFFAATAYATGQNPEDCTTTTTTTSDCETSTTMKTWGHTTTKPSTPTQTPDDDDDEDVCGSGMELNCCNRQVSHESADVGPHGSGLLSGLVNGLGGGAGDSILGDCSPIDVASRKFLPTASSATSSHTNTIQSSVVVPLSTARPALVALPAATALRPLPLAASSTWLCLALPLLVSSTKFLSIPPFV